MKYKLINPFYWHSASAIVSTIAAVCYIYKLDISMALMWVLIASLNITCAALTAGMEKK